MLNKITTVFWNLLVRMWVSLNHSHLIHQKRWPCRPPLHPGMGRVIFLIWFPLSVTPSLQVFFSFTLASGKTIEWPLHLSTMLSVIHRTKLNCILVFHGTQSFLADITVLLCSASDFHLLELLQTGHRLIISLHKTENKGNTQNMLSTNVQ